MANGHTVKQRFSVVNNDKETIEFEQCIDKKLDSIIIDCETGEIVFGFNIIKEMTNSNGTLLGIISPIYPDKWVFLACSPEGVYSRALMAESSSVSEVEQEIVKWLIQTDQYETFRTK